METNDQASEDSQKTEPMDNRNPDIHPHTQIVSHDAVGDQEETFSDLSSATPTDDDVQRILEELEENAIIEQSIMDAASENSSKIVIESKSMEAVMKNNEKPKQIAVVTSEDAADDEIVFEDDGSSSELEVSPMEGAASKVANTGTDEIEVVEVLQKEKDAELGEVGVTESQELEISLNEGTISPEQNESQSPMVNHGETHATSTEASEQPAPPNTSITNRRGLVAYFTVCVCVVLVLQIVIVWLVVKDDDDTSDKSSLVQIKSDPPAAALYPSVSPSESPSSKPSVSAGGFQSIASMPGATRLNTLSECANSNGCTEAFGVPSGQFLEWDNNRNVSRLSVDSNGSVNVGCCGRIDVVSMDMMPYVSGDIYILWDTDEDSVDELMQVSVEEARQFNPNIMLKTSLIVSYEDVMVYGYWGDDPYRVNAQARISSWDDIQICYGEGSTGKAIFRSGVTDSVSSSFYIPATGDEFDAKGYADEFPSNSCQTFQGDSRSNVPTIAPSWTPTSPWTPFPTVYPTLRPIYSPTLKPSTQQPYTPVPTYTPGPTTPDSFVSIANLNGALKLRSVSNCDNCTEPTRVPVRYFWRGIPIREFYVSSDGFAELRGECRQDSYGTCALIRVAEMDLNPGASANGNIWTLDLSSSGYLIISWEDIQVNTDKDLFDDDQILDLLEPDDLRRLDEDIYPTDRINAQVRLYLNGRVDVCWGSINLSSVDQVFTTSVVDYTNGSEYPATGPHFDKGGISRPLKYPTFMCQTLLDSSTTAPPSTPTDERTPNPMSLWPSYVPEPASTFQPTVSPTMFNFVTNRPSVSPTSPTE